MSIKRWAKEDEEILKKKFKEMSNKELAEFFGVSPIAIQRKLSRMGLIRQTQKKWTKKEEDFLREHYLSMKDKELAEYFGVSEIAIRRKLNRLGLKRSNKKDSLNKKISFGNNKKEKIKVVVKQYSITDVYRIGDIIYHPIFDDNGKIVAKEITPGGLSIIWVNFKKKGKVKLVECVRLDI